MGGVGDLDVGFRIWKWRVSVCDRCGGCWWYEVVTGDVELFQGGSREADQGMLLAVGLSLMKRRLVAESSRYGACW